MMLLGGGEFSTVVNKEDLLGRGFRMPVCSRYSLRFSISSLSAVKRKGAVLSSWSMVTALPLILVMQSTGFFSCGTQLAAPHRLSKESLMTQSFRAARFSAAEYCSHGFGVGHLCEIHLTGVVSGDNGRDLELTIKKRHAS